MSRLADSHGFWVAVLRSEFSGFCQLRGTPYWRSPALFVLLAVTVITIAGATICASSADGHTAPGTP
jgi:hypothetical protein